MNTDPGVFEFGPLPRTLALSNAATRPALRDTCRWMPVGGCRCQVLLGWPTGLILEQGGIEVGSRRGLAGVRKRGQLPDVGMRATWNSAG